MTDQIATFKALHVPGDPLMLFNIWDAGSARAVAGAGARAIATGSYGVAEAQGFKDGETFSIEDALRNLERIVSVTDLPVTLDFESGYGDSPAQVAASPAQENPAASRYARAWFSCAADQVSSSCGKRSSSA